MKKKIVTITIAAMMAASFCGCAGQSTTDQASQSATEETDTQSGTEEASQSATEEGTDLSTTEESTTAVETQADDVYQVALLQSLTLGNYDGLISVGDLKTHGDIGIGTFEGVNGEMIVLDGTVYQALSDGSVVEASDDEMVPYATVGFMDNDIEADITAKDIDELKANLDEIVEENGKNQFYFVRIDCTCSNIEVRSELKQEKPYKPLDEALATDQREFTYDDMEGTIVALYCPDYMSGLNTPGWHFHFVSEDRQYGGHMLAISGMEGQLKMDQISDFEFYCPNTEDFNNMELGQDQGDRIQSVEQKSK